ncbi:MAG: hypothetical protein MI975_03990 [Cytophagales bacterium]|nr:hypothetical protein [Cytophagales bacterium]
MSKLTYRFSKLDEHFLIPVAWMLMVAVNICGIYLVNEYLKPSYYFKEFYGWDTDQMLAYKNNVRTFILTFIGLIAGFFVSLRIRKRWLYLTFLVVEVLFLFQFRVIL